MAQDAVPLRFLLVAAMLIAAAGNYDVDDVKETYMSLYFHAFLTGLNVTSIPVAGTPGTLWSPNQFGTLYVHDDPITEGPDINSTPVGSAQGIHVTASEDGMNLLSVFSIVFSNQAYNGSTLQIYGTSKQFEQVAEVSVVSETGKFRFARGFATMEKYFVYVPTAYMVIRCNVSIVHF